MEISTSSLRAKTLRHAIDERQYHLYRAALEWSLIDPIVIQSRDDLKSEFRWRDRIEPYHHQVRNLITFCRRLPVTLLADDVGLGKTISAGLIASELISRGRVSKILIVCPKLLMPQWEEELRTKFGIPSTAVTGRKLVEAQPPEDVGAVITTYQSARIYLDALAGSGFEMLVLDEAHKLRNLYGVEHPPQVAQRFREVLSEGMFKYVLMLTATPIQNRLWDIYSLVDLLTVARGHENPFGKPGIFARKYIEDDRNHARRLKPEARDEFRSVVYGYMSRVRRSDANLHFPERVVRLHRVDPTPEELELLNVIREPIKELQYLAQLVILQALISSPQALSSVLNSMARNKTAPESLAASVKSIVERTTITAKLNGLGVLIDKLRKEQPEQWRVVVFTRWRETQTSIQIFLEEKGISYGLINGDSGVRNQEAIEKFRKEKPEIHVIISTEAGSEGVNLQSANVVVNYDLPWNPMIVEQRIGRVQRLKSTYASVSIFNIVLKGTFEEYIVGRLMEKLQMASHAIGDIESLLEASGLDENEGGTSGFEEKILQLVLASLNGANVEEATKKAEKSIDDAKLELEREEKNINSMLGGMDGLEGSGPQLPTLPEHPRSMDARSFVLTALGELGAEVVEKLPNELYLSRMDGKDEWIRFVEKANENQLSVYYNPGSAPFERLVNRITTTGLHIVQDVDSNIEESLKIKANEWIDSFKGVLESCDVEKVFQCFDGEALLKIRATVAVDSYERLVSVKCSYAEHKTVSNKRTASFVIDFIEEPQMIGLQKALLIEGAKEDPGIAEFSRFYIQRREQEVSSAGTDTRKAKKLEDDFTPRLDISLVGLNGKTLKEVELLVIYNLGTDQKYRSKLTVIPSLNEITTFPEMARCEKTSRLVPIDCLGICEISKMRVLRHLLMQSALSQRLALPDYIVHCTLSGKQILTDEAERSSVTNQWVTKSLLHTSALSGKRAEPQYMRKCEFSLTEVLEAEASISQISGKYYRIDEELRSVVSGKTGHRQEFIYCAVTGQPLIPDEAEKCQITGKVVTPGILQPCEVSGLKVLPTELERSVVSGKKALKKYFVTSSASGGLLLEQEATQSISGKFCAPIETKQCLWSGNKYHPDDIRVCELTGISFHFEFADSTGRRLEDIDSLLNDRNRKSDKAEIWSQIRAKFSLAVKGEVKIKHGILSPTKKHLAVCADLSTWLGLKMRQVGFIYSIEESEIVGKIAMGKHDGSGWKQLG